jgi:two-component system sensor histidine kinase UhpB
VKAGRTIRGWETRHKNKQKKHFDVALSAWPIKDFSGKITGVSMIVRDISWRKDLERQRHNYLQRLEAEVGKRTEELIEKNARLRHLSAYMHDVREQERATIAREIHDELGQWLTALKMDLALSQRYITKDIDRASRKLKDMTHVVDSTIGSVQRLVSELRPTVLDNLGLVPALEWYLQEFEKRYHIPARMEIESDETDFSDQTAIAIYRIFQECLSNIARHAGATEVVMQISQDGDTWKLTVADNGIGLPPEKLQEDRSFGLMGMQERAEACGGSVDFVTAPGQGTKITLYIPLVRTYGQNINH